MSPYDRGREDFNDGKSRGDCPYINLSAAYEWERGWDDAAAEQSHKDLKEGRYEH